ncbi:uncharacterized protein B0T15DRAFT_219257 [Chaetomium strumarium]|uniref:Uncharacterized protein n=1 Tax=Chaetomium strumarium TaxID=1170767 RepID=A0AAJ0GU35_9PEZI|nr:hypothetical protein B0T15DRAFT_219257 [Chaetomium strumarium]
MISPNTLYITLQYLQGANNNVEFHWGLYITDRSAPNGHFLSVIDANPPIMDLRMELREIENPTKAPRMVVCLKIATSPGLTALHSAASAVRLMENEHLPDGEHQWNSRVWVKEVLSALAKRGYIQMPWGLEQVEQNCLYTAKENIQSAGRPVVYNELAWLTRKVDGALNGPGPLVPKPRSRVELPTESPYAEAPAENSRPRAELPTGRSHEELPA